MNLAKQILEAIAGKAAQRSAPLCTMGLRAGILKDSELIYTRGHDEFVFEPGLVAVLEQNAVPILESHGNGLAAAYVIGGALQAVKHPVFLFNPSTIDVYLQVKESPGLGDRSRSMIEAWLPFVDVEGLGRIPIRIFTGAVHPFDTDTTYDVDISSAYKIFPPCSVAAAGSASDSL